MLAKGNTAIDGLSGNASAGCRFLVCHDAEDADRPRDVLEALLAEIREGEVEPACRVLLHPRRNADAAGLGQTFEPGRDIDAVAKDVVVLDDNIALVNAGAEVDAAVYRQRTIAIGQRRLQLGRTPHRVDDARKLDQ